MALPRAKFQDGLRTKLPLWKKRPTLINQKLFKEGRKATKYLQLYDSLFKEFLIARSKDHIVNFGWLWSKAKKLQAEIDLNVEVKYHVIVHFLQFKQLGMRAKERNKKKHRKEHEPLLKKWLATYREKCIRTGADNPSYGSKWGRFKPIEILSVGQSPFPFAVHGKKTYKFIPAGEW